MRPLSWDSAELGMKRAVPLGEGDTCECFLVDETTVVRLAKHKDASRSLERELCLLPVLRKQVHGRAEWLREPPDGVPLRALGRLPLTRRTGWDTVQVYGRLSASQGGPGGTGDRVRDSPARPPSLHSILGRLAGTRSCGMPPSSFRQPSMRD